MRKTNVTKTLVITLLFIVLSVVYSNKVQASEATLSVSNCNVGEEFTVTVNIPNDIVGYEGNISITYSNGNKVSLDRMIASPASLSYTGNYTGKFKADVAGQATVTVSNLKMYNMASLDNLTSVDAEFSPVNSTKTLMQNITISAPVVNEPPVSTPPVDNAQTSDVPSQTTPTTENTPATPSTTTATPSSAPTSTPAPVILNFKDTNEKMYTSRRVNVRQSYGTDSNIIQTLAVGTEITRTGISDGNKDGYSWSRVSYNGITGYLITGALTYDAPVKDEQKPEEKPEENTEKPEEEVPEEKTDENTEENPEEVEENNEISVESIAEELGAIPEVGVNIMPYMFFGSVVVCVVLMVETKRKLA